MVSLSTVYGITIVLGSLAAMGSAYLGTKVYPIQKGGDPMAAPVALAAAMTSAFAAAENVVKAEPEQLAVETVKEEPVQEEAPVSEAAPEVAPETAPETVPEAVPETAPEVAPEEEKPAEPEKVGGKKLPPWFKHSGAKH